jgi:hypothetical protein
MCLKRIIIDSLKGNQGPQPHQHESSNVFLSSSIAPCRLGPYGPAVEGIQSFVHDRLALLKIGLCDSVPRLQERPCPPSIGRVVEYKLKASRGLQWLTSCVTYGEVL